MSIDQPYFAKGVKAAVLNHIRFEGCELRRARFSTSKAACNLRNVSFFGCRIARCSFSNTALGHDGPNDAFEGSLIERTSFNGASLKELTLKGCEIRGCTFWNATLTNVALPPELYEMLNKAGLLNTNDRKRWVVASRREAIRANFPAGLLTLLRFELRLTYFNSSVDGD
ncbi:MAG: pentapeptide repeat-containing protein [Novosphingobium sp.]